MSFKKGDIRILHLKVDDEYVPIGCLTTNGFQETTETVDTTTRASGGWKTSIPATQSFNITFEGIRELADSTILSYNDIRTLKRNRTRIEWGLSEEGNIVDEGFGYLTEISETAAIGEFISFSGNILGYGVPVTVEVTGDLFQDGNSMLFQDGNSIIFQ